MPLPPPEAESEYEPASGVFAHSPFPHRDGRADARAILDDLHTGIQFKEIAALPLPVDDWLMREIDG
jgi:hypothetical protein